MKLRIVQCLCPQRHCMVALPYEPEVETKLPNGNRIALTQETAAKFLKDLVEELISRQVVKPSCGICGSTDLRYEDSATKFNSLEEAMPHLIQLEAENRETRKLFNDFSRHERN